MSDEYDDATYTEADLVTAATFARLEAERASVRTLLAFAAAHDLPAASVLKALSGTNTAPSDPPVDDGDDADDDDTDLWTPSEAIEAAFEIAEEAAAAGEDASDVLELLAERVGSVKKAFDESKVKRDHGKFSSTGGASGEPKTKTGKVAAPKKPTKTELKQQRRSEAKAAAHAHLKARASGKTLSASEAADLIGHLAHLTHADLRELRKEHGASFGGERRKGNRTASLVKWAKNEIGKKRRAQQGSALQQTVDYGGIDPNSADFKRFYGSMKDAVNDGIPMAAFKRGGNGLDEIAAQMVSAGHISLPDWEDPSEHLIGLLRGRKMLSWANTDAKHADAYAEHVAAQLENDDGSATFDPNKEWDDEDPDWFSKAFDLHHDATDAERLDAAALVALQALEDGSDPEEALARLHEHGTFAKAWDKDKHPRDDKGRFVSKDAIQAAKSDPKKAKELKKRVTDPEQRKKLDAALADPEVIGTQRGLKRHESETKRAEKVANRAKAREIRIRLIDQDSRGEELNPDDLRALIPHLSQMSHEELSHTRELLARQGASFGGKRLRADRVAALVAWATGKAQPAQATEPVANAESGSGTGNSSDWRKPIDFATATPDEIDAHMNQFRRNPEDDPQTQGEKAKAYGDALRSMPQEVANEFIKRRQQKDSRDRRSRAGTRAAATRSRNEEALAEKLATPTGRRLHEAEQKVKELGARYQIGGDVTDSMFERAQRELTNASLAHNLYQTHKEPDVVAQRRNDELPPLNVESGAGELEATREMNTIPWTVSHFGDTEPTIVSGARLQDSSTTSTDRVLRLYGIEPGSMAGDSQTAVKNANELGDWTIHFDKGDPAQSARARRLVSEIARGKAQNMTVGQIRQLILTGKLLSPEEARAKDYADDAAKYAKPDTGTAAAQPAPTGTSAAPPKTRLQALAEKAHAAGTPSDDPNTEYATPRDQYLAFTRAVVPPSGTKPDSATVLDYLSKLPDHARERLDQHFRASGKSLREIEQFHRQAAGQVTPEQVRAERAARADAGDAARAAMTGSGAGEKQTHSVGDTLTYTGRAGSMPAEFRGYHTDPGTGEKMARVIVRPISGPPFEASVKPSELSKGGTGEQEKQRQEAQVGGNVSGAGRADGGTGGAVATAQPAQKVPVPEAPQGVGKPAGRFVSVRKDGRTWEVHSVHNDLGAFKDRLGLKHFDTQTGTWVKPGARGPVKDKNARVQYGEVPQSLDHLVDPTAFKTVEQMRQQFARSDDTFTEHDQRGHYNAVKNALALGKPVPPAVLADYPDLAAKYGQTGSVAAPTPTGTSAVPDLAALKKNPKADVEHIAALQKQHAEGSPEWEALETARFNAQNVHTRDNSALAALHGKGKDAEAHGRRHFALERLASAAAQAHEQGDAAGHKAATDAVTSLGGTMHGPKAGETTTFDGSHYDGPAGAFTGDAVRVTRQPVKYNGALVYRGKVEPVASGSGA